MMNYDGTAFEPFGDESQNFDELRYSIPVTYEDFLYSLKESVFGQDEELTGIAYDIYSYLQGVSEGKPVRHNFILAGPSASGKTELFRTVKKLLETYNCPVPVLRLDISRFSPTGFQGEEISVIPEMIRNVGSGGAAIVFMDEFDKILIPLYGSNGDNVNRVVQYELLTLIEGSVCNVKQNNKTRLVNTEMTLFIGMGAFTEYREEKARKKQVKAIGFLSAEDIPAETDVPKVTDVPEATEDRLTMEDLKRVGSVPELLGRFDNVYNFHSIEEEVFQDLFKHFIEDLAIEQEILIKASETAVKEFFSLVKSEYGCREVKRTLYNTVKPCLIKIADETGRIQYRIEVYGIDKAKLKKRTESVQTSITR